MLFNVVVAVLMEKFARVQTDEQHAVFAHKNRYECPWLRVFISADRRATIRHRPQELVWMPRVNAP